MKDVIFSEQLIRFVLGLNDTQLTDWFLPACIICGFVIYCYAFSWCLRFSSFLGPIFGFLAGLLVVFASMNGIMSLTAYWIQSPTAIAKYFEYMPIPLTSLLCILPILSYKGSAFLKFCTFICFSVVALFVVFTVQAIRIPSDSMLVRTLCVGLCWNYLFHWYNVGFSLTGFLIKRCKSKDYCLKGPYTRIFLKNADDDEDYDEE